MSDTTKDGIGPPEKATPEQLSRLGTLAACRRMGIVPETARELGIALDYENLTASDAERLIAAVEQKPRVSAPA